MGTPRTKTQYAASLQSPDAVETLRLLTLGAETKPIASIENIFTILEELKASFLPMVYHLDKPLREQMAFSKAKMAVEFRKPKVMVVLNRHDEGRFFSLALDREGLWFAEFPKDGAESEIQRLTSEELATAIMQLIGEAQLLFAMDARKRTSEELAERLPFLDKVFSYMVLLRFVNNCCETVEKVIAEREERFRIMRKRIGLVQEFGAMLDPLKRAGNGKKVLPGYAIWRNHNPSGAGRSTTAYLS